MHFFGPSDEMSEHTLTLMKWKVKMATNDDMRQQFLSLYVPKIQELELSLPDAELRKDPDSGKWLFGDPDWTEFFAVIRGNGPCNAERLAVRKAAEVNGAWVRKALQQADARYVTPLA
jgi:ring-1,2-phenylacetyl-CoA epoxidase subunit PaaA